MRSILSRWTVGVVVAFLLLCPHLRMYLDESTRYYSFWGRRDAVSLAAAVGMLGTLFFLTHTLVRALRVTWLSRAADAAFVLIVGFAVIAYVRISIFDGTEFWSEVGLVGLICLVTALGAGSLAPRLTKIPRFFRAVCLVVSPVVTLVLVQLLYYPNFSVSNETLPKRAKLVAAQSDPPQDNRQSVYLFLFDEWSYQRTFERPDFHAEFPHLASLMRTATVYHDAHSPHRSTGQSLPAILFQTANTYVYTGGYVGFEDSEGEFVSTQACDSLFSQTHAAGHNTYLVGWYHPYRLMFGPELDFCWTAPSSAETARSDTILGGTGRHLRIGLGKSIVAIPKPAALQWRAKRLVNGAESEHAIEVARKIHDLALTIIQDDTGPCFAVFHYAVPHWPFVYDRDGLNPNAAIENPLYFGLNNDRQQDSPDPDRYVERYIGNLRYTDTLIGELIDRLRSAGKFASSTIVLTSDHGWRDDPSQADEPTMDELTHVPLIIKYPYQNKPVDVEEPFALVNLRQMLRRVQDTVQVIQEPVADASGPNGT